MHGSNDATKVLGDYPDEVFCVTEVHALLGDNLEQ
jgi:hypothetical protein